MITREQAKANIKSEQDLMGERHVKDALEKVEKQVLEAANNGWNSLFLCRGTASLREYSLTIAEFYYLRQKLEKEYGYTIESIHTDKFQLKFD